MALTEYRNGIEEVEVNKEEFRNNKRVGVASTFLEKIGNSKVALNSEPVWHCAPGEPAGLARGCDRSVASGHGTSTLLRHAPTRAARPSQRRIPHRPAARPPHHRPARTPHSCLQPSRDPPHKEPTTHHTPQHEGSNTR
ncbi:unnamed protein product, partial [Brenthis ino]